MAVSVADATALIAEPPDEVCADLRAFAAALDQVVPAKVLDRNLLVGTWNIRCFGDATKKWHSSESDEPQRDLRDLCLIAELVSRFDVVAIQEVRDNLRALRYMLRRLGRDWSFTLTDVTKGSDGNNERLAFLFDTAALATGNGRVLARVVRPRVMTASWVAMRPVWDEPAWDLALLVVDEEEGGAENWSAPGSGPITIVELGSSAEPECEAVGFPDSEVQEGADPSERDDDAGQGAG